jgi:hypothetical protein
MKGIEFYKAKSLEKTLQEAIFIRDFIIEHSQNCLTEDDFTIGYLNNTDIYINIDEKNFYIDEMDICYWLNNHFNVIMENDKRIIIQGFKH